MKKDIAKLWADAVMDRKRFPPSAGGLADYGYGTKPTFNVLGVLCELAIEAGVEIEVTEIKDKSFKNRVRLYDGERYLLPDAVVEWAGMKNKAGIWEIGKPGVLGLYDIRHELDRKEMEEFASKINEKQEDL